MSEDRGDRLAPAAFAVAVTALVLYATSLGNGFAYDDVPIIEGDARIRSLVNLRAILTSGYWHNSDLALYRPLTTLSFALDWSLAPGNAAWFHFTNVLLHAGASALALLLLARLFPVPAALAGGLIFAVHPVHVEAVANVVGRAELLSAIFFFAAALLWMPRDPDPAEPRAPARLLVVGGLFALALLSKESAIMLPAGLVLVDAARGALDPARPGSYLRRNAAAFLALGFVVTGYFALRSAVLGSFAPARVDPVLEVAASSRARILTALQAWPIYAQLMFFPVTLLADYGPRVTVPALAITAGAAAGAVLLGVVLVAGLVALLRGAGRAALAWLWFPVTVLPVSNLIVPIGVLVAERTLYLPSYALSIAVAAAAARAPSARPATRRAALAALAALLLLLGARVLARTPEWASTDTIFVALVRDRPDSFRGHWHLARMARARGDDVSALAEYDTAVALWPHRARLVVEAAGFAAVQGDLRTALRRAALAADRWPEDIDVLRLLAGIALDAGDTATAARAARHGLRIRPDDEVLQRMIAAMDSTRFPGTIRE